MANILFTLLFSGLLYFILKWSFARLPDEKWQVMACVPLRKNGEEQWNGMNLTWYGALNAGANVLGTILVFVLMGSLHLPLSMVFIVVGIILGVCIPAAKIVARVVEKKKHTFSVGGASFVGILLAPPLVGLVRLVSEGRTEAPVSVVAIMAAFSIAYAFGEGVGRLACISFGCCYGKPLSETHPALARLFSTRHFIFTGKTKKISYAHGLDSVPVVPIQAVTSVIYCTFGAIGLVLFFFKFFGTAFILTLFVTQFWRFLSEFLRADYRGGGGISAYQIMGLFAIAYSIGVAALFHDAAVMGPDVMAGLAMLWNPAMILFFQALFVAVFLFTGRSQVTGSVLSFHVREDRI